MVWASKDEIERRGVAPTTTEADLSRSSTYSMANRRCALRSLQPIVRLLALRGTPNSIAYEGLTPHLFKYRRKNAPCKISVKRGTRRQIHRRNNNIHVSQEDDNWAKAVGEATRHDTGDREYKCCDQQLRQYAAPTYKLWHI